MQVDLVERASRGDRDAFAMLVRDHVDRCYGLAYRILRDHHRAQDATQQALLGAWRDLPALREPHRFEARAAENGQRQDLWILDVAGTRLVIDGKGSPPDDGDIVVGPTVDDLAEALAGSSAYESTTPVDATLGGFSGKRLELQLAPDPSGCDS